MSITENKYSVSVVIPAYNIGDFIARAINSVLAQTHPPDEIIVVDDGSTDNTGEVVKGFGEKVIYIHQQNGGLSAARNTAMRASTCKWISFLDGDDEWLEAFRADPNAAGMAAGVKHFVCGLRCVDPWKSGYEMIDRRLARLYYGGGRQYFKSRCYRQAIVALGCAHQHRKTLKSVTLMVLSRL
ncbi:hypothetical protein LCGC14_3072500, partial [marine sediment metagenome]